MKERSAKSGAKPLASISVDLDNLWSYLKIYGDRRWKELPTFLDVFIPATLGILENLGIVATFFVVGQDADLEENWEVLGQITEKGHELGNHSFSHDAWLYKLSGEQIEAEIINTEDKIFMATATKPVGFRGPGFSWSPELLDILEKRGYLYDATSMPTFIGPIAKAYYFRKSGLTAIEKRMRDEGAGGFKEGLRPVRPYLWRLNSGRHLLEIPVTTVPIIRTPFHMSYLLFLSRLSVAGMLIYLKLALFLCRLTGTAPSFIIHPTDLLSLEQVPGMHFFPGMHMTSKEKMKILDIVIKEFTKSYCLVSIQTYARSILGRDLPYVSPFGSEPRNFRL